MKSGKSRRRKPPIPKRPYRDSAILYAVMAGVLLAISVLTGGSLATAVIVAGAFFVVATGWTWYRFRRRMQQEDDG